MELAKRFVDNGDGTVTDLETKLIWKQTDSFQDTSKWNNWFRAQEYIQSLNIEKFAGILRLENANSRRSGKSSR